MIFPVRTDRRLTNTPWVNYLLIALNVMLFVWSLGRADTDPLYVQLILDPSEPGLWNGIPYQFITYQFLHSDGMHLFGNMIFLYVFGNSVEDRLGKIAYLAFYLAGGVLAGLGHTLLDSNPVLGASGSIAAVTGAYLALFPHSNVTIFYWFFFIGTFEVYSIYLILLQVAQDLVFQFGGSRGVAHMAHLSGYVWGFGVGMCLLWSRLLPREPFDLLSLIEHRRRRSEFDRLTRQGYHPWSSPPPSPSSSPSPGSSSYSSSANSRSATLASGQSPQGMTAAELRIFEQRNQVVEAWRQHDLAKAAEGYQRLLEIDPKQVMSQTQQIDLANQLLSVGRHSQAAQAYELCLATYPKYEQREQIELILALVYARYVRRRERALELLASASSRLNDPQQKDLARQLQSELA